MQFSSLVFLLAFMPAVIVIYFCLNKFKNYKFGMAFIFVASLLFYGYANIYYPLILLADIVINYLLSKMMKGKKAILVLSLILNIGTLFVLKYTDFVLSSVCHLFQADDITVNILLPIGISFITFQQISYCMDVYRGEIVCPSFIDYACYIAYFPKIMEGPITPYETLLPQFRDSNKKHINFENLTKGLTVFTIGLAKKVLIADTLAKMVDYGYKNVSELNSITALLCVVGYSLQIYYDFSGYCDMAIGISKCLNIDLPINFDSPYKSKSILEFWKRWHITLTQFLTKYIYIPLGGNRKGKVRTYINVLLVFLISGLWHGANFTFIVWGALHGVASVLNRVFKKQYDRLLGVFRWILTFSFVNLAWVFFRAESVSQAIKIIKALFSFTGGGIPAGFVEPFIFVEIDAAFRILSGTSIAYYGVYLIVAFFAIALLLLALKKNTNNYLQDYKPHWLKTIVVSGLFCWCLMSLSNVSGFIYNGF